MTFEETIKYRLDLNGNLPSQARDGANALDDLDRSAKRAKRSTDDSDKAAEGLRKTLMKLGAGAGGPLGNLTAVADDLMDSLEGASAALGAVGIATGGAVIGVGVLAASVVSLANASVDARDRLVEQGLASVLPAGASESIDAYTASIAAASIQVDLLTVAIGSDLAGALVTVIDLGAGFVGILADLSASSQDTSSWIGQFREFTEGAGRAAFAFATLGQSEMIPALVGIGVEARNAMRGVEDLQNTMSDGDMYAALGLTSDAPSAGGSKPRPVAASALKPIIDIVLKSAEQAGPSAAVINLDDGLVRLDGIVAGLGDHVSEYSDVINELTAMNRRDNLNRAATTATDYLGAASTGSVAAVVGTALSNAGPIGALVTGIVSIAGDLESTADELTGNLVHITDNLPKGLAAVINDVPETILATLPSLLEMVVTLVPTLIEATVKMVGQLFSAEFWNQMGKAIGDAIMSALDPFDKERKSDRDTTAGIAGTNEAAKGLKLPKNIPSFAEQTPLITRSGLAIVHRGEEIRAAGSGGRSVTINVGKIETKDPVDFVRQIQRMLGPYGANLSLTGRP